MPAMAGQRPHPDLPMVSQDPRDPAFVQNPYPFYRKLRALGPLVWWTEYNRAMATTQAAVSTVLRHPGMGREVPPDRRPQVTPPLEPFYAVERHSLLELEPPEHTRIRRIAMQGFGRASLARMGPEVSRISDALIDAFPSGPFDVLEAYARPLPALVATRFFGLADDMAPQLQAWSNDMVAMYQARRNSEIENAAGVAAAEFRDFLGSVIAERRKRPGEDFLSELLSLDARGGGLSSDELISTVILLLNAGHEATVHSLGNAVARLANYPDRGLVLEPGQIEGTVEECLRFDPPLHMFSRYVYKPVNIEGEMFHAGDEIGCLLASASRDDAVWPDGDRFDPLRARRQHLAFGSGIHVCIGASLARLEMQIALPILFARCPGLKVTEAPQFADAYHFHGYERLVVEVRPANPSST